MVFHESLLPDDPLKSQAKSLEVIAEELQRLRALKEYELGVLSTTTEETDGISLVAGDNKFAEVNSRRHRKGDVIWNEDKGRI